MKKILYALLVAVSGLFSACDNEDSAPFAPNSDIGSRSSDVTEYLNITYKDTTYLDVPTTYDENGDFVFMDDEFATVYESELANDMDWSISATDANNITFYADLKSNLEKSGIDAKEAITLINDASDSNMESPARGGETVLLNAILYDDKDFKDRSVAFTIYLTKPDFSYANFGDYPWQFNDKCSSMVISNQMKKDYTDVIYINGKMYKNSEVYAVFIGYDDRNFSDRTITCVVPHETLKKYPSLPGFNDKMSSC